MRNSPAKRRFLAVLIFRESEHRLTESPLIFTATHPEIAYQMAYASGKEQRYGLTFLGLSRLEETEQDETPDARSFAGDPWQAVVDKEALEIFASGRWQDIPMDELELELALQLPPVLFEIPGVQQVRWEQLSHAYGSATDVPRDLRNLAACDPVVRQQALWNLGGSIYHQGDLCTATVPAVSLLLQFAVDPRLSERAEICGLMNAIATSSSRSPAAIERTWSERAQLFGERYRLTAAKMAAEQVAITQAVRQVFREQEPILRLLSQDTNTEVAAVAQRILHTLANAGDES